MAKINNKFLTPLGGLLAFGTEVPNLEVGDLVRLNGVLYEIIGRIFNLDDISWIFTIIPRDDVVRD